MYIYIQKCFTRIFQKEIILYHFDNDTYMYMGRRLVLQWLDYENFMRRSQKILQLSYILLKKKSVIELIETGLKSTPPDPLALP